MSMIHDQRDDCNGQELHRLASTYRLPDLVKQASHDDLDPSLIKRYERYIGELYSGADDLYHNMVSNGVAKECARSILPLGTPTRILMNGTLRSLLHYIQIRAGIETQLEHRLIALAVKSIFEEQFPTIYEAAFGSQ